MRASISSLVQEGSLDLLIAVAFRIRSCVDIGILVRGYNIPVDRPIRTSLRRRSMKLSFASINSDRYDRMTVMWKSGSMYTISTNASDCKDLFDSTLTPTNGNVTDYRPERTYRMGRIVCFQSLTLFSKWNRTCRIMFARWHILSENYHVA